jgi:hypothetical protein
MSKPMIRIHDLATDEVIDREMTAAEFADYKLQQDKKESDQAEVNAKASAKAALLDKLGITAEEAALLLS